MSLIVDVYVYKYRQDHTSFYMQYLTIASYLFGHNKYLAAFHDRNKVFYYLHQILMPFICPCSHHLLVPASIFHAVISPCSHLRKLSRYKNDNWILFVTLHWIYNYKCQTKVFWMAKWHLVEISRDMSWSTAAFSVLGLKSKHIFKSLLNLNVGKRGWDS